jgi:hypothetical protein
MYHWHSYAKLPYSGHALIILDSYMNEAQNIVVTECFSLLFTMLRVIRILRRKHLRVLENLLPFLLWNARNVNLYTLEITSYCLSTPLLSTYDSANLTGSILLHIYILHFQ